MSTTTDSHIVERHEDGTWTETIVVHGRPATKKENIISLTLVGVMTVVAVSPLAYAFGIDWWERRQDRKEAARKLQSV